MMMEEKLRLYIRDMKNIIYIKDLIGVKPEIRRKYQKLMEFYADASSFLIYCA
jgi:hypothetical protein